MSFRNRPVLDRKHRPRWQDELRTQQLTVIGFAIAIALALGIFGASAWNGYWDSHLRPIASVEGTTFNRSDLAEREQIMTAEAIAKVTELQGQMTGGVRDQIIQQQIDSLSSQFDAISTNATASLVDQAVLGLRAGEMGITVTDEEVDAALAERLGLEERINANLILIDPLPDDADADDEPTEEQIAAATEEAQAARDRVEGGESFADVAADVSDDFTASFDGSLGWFYADDASYAEYFKILADAEDGDLVGPVETANGVAVLQLLARRDATDDGGLRKLLTDRGIDDATYRDFVAGDLLTDAFHDHFNTRVAVTPAAQRRVAEIYIAPVTGTVVPQERARHILIQPDPELDDQSEATDEQWDAALETARKVEDLVREPDADWGALAKEYSDDTGSASRGGDLGWYDPANSQFVDPFAVELASLEVGEISDPIRTDFGWHIIQKTGERDSPQAQAADILARLEEDPDSFADIARAESEDSTTAADGGELGWVARYQLTRMQEEAVFALSEVGDISPIVDEGSGGISIFKLLEASPSHEIEEARLNRIRSTGFTRWLDEVVRAPVQTWIDPEFASSSSTV